MVVELTALQGLILGALMVQWRLASAWPSIPMLVIRLQCVYLLLAYLARPLYQEVTKPGYGEFLYDNRIAPSYVDGLIRPTQLALMGVIVSAATIYLVIIAAKRSSQLTRAEYPTFRLRVPSNGLAISCLLYSLAWVCRIIAIAGAGNPFTSLLIPLAVPLACLTILLVSPSGRLLSPPVLFLLAAEMGAAALFASKTPIISVLTAVFMRALIQKSQPLRPRLVGGIASVAIISFIIIQPLKGINTVSELDGRTGGPAFSIAAGVLERFDGMSSIIDAESLGGGAWISPAEFSSRALSSLLPNGPAATDSTSLGQRWTQEVRSASVPNQYQYVPIAAGPTAEGYALGGVLGVIWENIVQVLASIVLALGLQRGGLVAKAYCSYFVFGTTLYELAFLGLAGANAKAIQLAALFLTLVALLGRRPHSADLGVVRGEGTAP